ncbi:MAG: hypothetical protein IJ180_05020 [Bacteroidales bacterium]|nr:hypothetical protein [Bacteroidales bacterium]
MKTISKFVLLFAVIIAGLSFIGCSDEEDLPMASDGNILIMAKVRSNVYNCIGGILLEVVSPKSIGDNGVYKVYPSESVQVTNAIEIPDFYRYAEHNVKIEGLEKLKGDINGLPIKSHLLLECRKCEGSDVSLFETSQPCLDDNIPLFIPRYVVTKIIDYYK